MEAAPPALPPPMPAPIAQGIRDEENLRMLSICHYVVGGLTIYAGRCLQRRRHRTFTFVMAGINCLHIPFGTALGVFTIIVLQRPSVVALYALQPAGRPLRASV